MAQEAADKWDVSPQCPDCGMHMLFGSSAHICEGEVALKFRQSGKRLRPGWWQVPIRVNGVPVPKGEGYRAKRRLEKKKPPVVVPVIEAKATEVKDKPVSAPEKKSEAKTGLRSDPDKLKAYYREKMRERRAKAKNAPSP
jgi:hypothetical protein